ncbi:MAG TPA: DUF4349 domain-containing protein, partial [Actinomycetota bacterium]|nr:DUF4349 domain-containing protein [Actinomycetota bacterium]
MEREIRYLRDLEGDLRRAADRARGNGPSRTAGAKRWIPAVAAVLVVAWGIGFVVENPISLGGSERATSGAGDGGSDAATGGAPQASPAPLEPEAPERSGYLIDEQAGPGPQDRERGLFGFGSLPGTADTISGDDARTDTSFGDLSKIIRTGRMRVKVDDGTFRDARDSAVSIAEGAGGFVLDSRVQGRSGTFTIRVPAARFDAVMTRLGRLGDVELEEQDGDDVTAEFVDLEARMRILTARRDVIQRLMEQTTSLSQSLMLQNRFDEVQLQLERITGQLRFLNDQIAESTIRLELVERTAPQQRQEQIENPSLLEAWKRGIEGFLNVLAVAIIG